MYLAQPQRLLLETVEHLRGLTSQLHLKPGPGGSTFSPWDATKQIYEPLLADLFPAITQVAVVALWPSSQIVAHTDAPITGTRYHIPLQTNPGCWSFSAGGWQQLALGMIYQMDPTVVHGAVNWGTEIRLNLLVDVG